MSQASKPILIIGYYGMKNTGDDAMSYSLVAGIHRSRPDVHIKIAASGPIAVPESSRDRVAFAARTPVAVMRAVRECRAIIWGGGTTLFSYRGRSWKWFKMLARQAVLFRAARVFGREVFLVGIGLGPFHRRWATRLARCALGAAEHVSLRDGDGYALARGWGLTGRLTEGFDLSALLPDACEPGRPRPEKSGRVLGVSLLPYYEIFRDDPVRNAQLRRHIVEALKHCMDAHRDLTVRLFVFKGPDRDHDADFVERVCGDLQAPRRAQVIPYNPDPVSRLREVGDCDFFAAMRLHASIFAYLCGLPMMILDYHAKCRAFHRQVGLAERALLGIEQIGGGMLGERLAGMISRPEEFRAALPPDVARRRASQMLEELCRRL